MNLSTIAHDVRDAAESLRHAARLAHEASGASGGREPSDVTVDEPCPNCDGTGRVPLNWSPYRTPGTPCPDCDSSGTWRSYHTDPGEPAVEGWPAMVALAGRLDELAGLVEGAIGAEVAGAIGAEGEDDR
jgi:hypothetical protein